MLKFLRLEIKKKPPYLDGLNFETYYMEIHMTIGF